MQTLISDVTHLHFCICLVSQVNPVIDWERNTQGCGYQEIRFTWRLVTIPINPPCQLFFFHMISVLLLWANYLACVFFLCAATPPKPLQSCPSLQSHRQEPTRLPRFWDSPGKNTGIGCHFLLQCMKVKSENEVAQSCLALSDPMDCSPLGSSVHGIFQARVLEWGAIAFSDVCTWVHGKRTLGANIICSLLTWWIKSICFCTSVKYFLL